MRLTKRIIWIGVLGLLTVVLTSIAVVNYFDEINAPKDAISDALKQNSDKNQNTKNGSGTPDKSIRIFTWDGYVTADDLIIINKELKKSGYDYEAEVIKPYADTSEQMYGEIKKGNCDITFLTLFFIKMQDEKQIQLLQPINTESPRLSNYKYLKEQVKKIPMGMENGDQVYYIPFACGVYGFWANMDKVSEADLPHSVNDLLSPKWKGKYSLNISQPWYNISLALMSLKMNPFVVNELVMENKRSEAMNMANPNNAVQIRLNDFYGNAGGFWTTGTQFDEKLSVVSSWGVEMKERIQRGENWKMINFDEGNLVWMDTINFTKQLSGRKLEAAEIVANYFASKEKQKKVVEELSLISVSSQVGNNPLLDKGINSFDNNFFIPPFAKMAENIMQNMSRNAIGKVK